MISHLSRYAAVLLLIALAFGCAPARVPPAENPAAELTGDPSLSKCIGCFDEELPNLLAVADEDYSANIEPEVFQGDQGSYDGTERAKEGGEKEQAILDSALELCEASQELWAEGDLNRAIDALDQAYALILKVAPESDAQLIQQKEDLRFTISRRILEIHASRYTAVNGNHKAIPLTMNEHVEHELKSFQGMERNFFVNAYKRSGKYREKIVEALQEAGLPEELSWLPLIESGFKVRALSSARALGLWQFIPSTGYKFGLNRDTWIDERMDPVKSTAAAIAYLKELHQIFGDWTTVLAAYNCGEGMVLRVIRDQRVNYLDNFWDLYGRLPRETARYVPRFLATLHIMKDPAKYGITLDELDEPIACDVVAVEKKIQLKAVAERLGVSYEGLCELNPELRHQVTPGTPYPLRVPPGTREQLLAKLDEIPEWSPPQRAYVSHRVRKGESLSLIALKYRTGVQDIARANNIRRTHLIRAGQELKIPLKAGKERPAFASNFELLPGGKYRVKKGDSLYLIARRFGTTTKALQRLNDLQSTRLHVGQVLKITKGEETRQAKAARTYRVLPGDNPSCIARKERIPLSRLLQANNLSLGSTIYFGQVLVIPQ